MTEEKKNWTRKRFVVSDIVRETEKAILVRVGDVEAWVAKKLCGSRVPEAAGDVLEIPMWLVEERGFKQGGGKGAAKRDEGEARLEAYKANLREVLEGLAAGEKMDLEDSVENRAGKTEIANQEGRYDATVAIIELLFPSSGSGVDLATWSFVTAKRTGTLCGVCGREQVESPSGVTCENGHGGAEPMSDEVRKLQAEQRKDAGLSDDDDDVPF